MYIVLKDTTQYIQNIVGSLFKLYLIEIVLIYNKQRSFNDQTCVYFINLLLKRVLQILLDDPWSAKRIDNFRQSIEGFSLHVQVFSNITFDVYYIYRQSVGTEMPAFHI